MAGISASRPLWRTPAIVSFLLVAAASPLPASEIAQALKLLVESELVHCRGVLPSAIYTFKHALVQDAAYGTLLRTKRLQLHASIAAALRAAVL